MIANRKEAMEEPEPEKILITIEKAAKLLSLSRTMVYRLIEREQLPVHRFNTAVRINIAELEEWLQKRREES